MKVARILSAVLLACLWRGGPAFAWGPEGHEVVAHVAARNLTPKAREAVGALLGGEAEAMMALDANWADEIRDNRPQTASWHYVNIEIDNPVYLPSRDCPRDNCVVAQIARDDSLLCGGAPAPAKAEALEFLIHFMGDIHQPLHAGERHDQGGNLETVRYRGRLTNLHRIWDSEMVQVLGRDPLALARAIDTSLTPAQKARLAGGGPRDWALESARLSRTDIYAGLPQGVVDINESYLRAHAMLARMQLAKAGLRLAATLNAIFQ